MEKKRKPQSGLHQHSRVVYLGSRAGAGKQSGASSGLNIRRTRHAWTKDLRRPAVEEAGGSDRNSFTKLKDKEKRGRLGYLV